MALLWVLVVLVVILAIVGGAVATLGEAAWAAPGRYRTPARKRRNM